MADHLYQTLNTALADAESATFLLEDGVRMLGELDAPGLHFIVMGLETQLAALTRHLEVARKTARAVRPRLSPRKATQLVVGKLVQEMRPDLPKADLPALVRAYEAESAAAEPNTTAGVVLDRAMRRMRAERAAA